MNKIKTEILLFGAFTVEPNEVKTVFSHSLCVYVRLRLRVRVWYGKMEKLNIILCKRRNINHTRTRCAMFSVSYIYYLEKTRYFSILYCLINYYQGV